MSSNLSFAKIVASASETTWSQVYHAGNLFAVVALTTEKEHPDLNSIGKEMFNTLEVEFFSLDEKNLTSIKGVIEENVKKLPEDVMLSACIAYSKEAVLYLFIIGKGEILMKRGEKIGVVLSQKTSERAVLSSSGYLKHGDVLLLQTGAFSELFDTEIIKQALSLHLPNDITDRLSTEITHLPGDASVLTLVYQGVSAPATTHHISESLHDKEEKEPVVDEDLPRQVATDEDLEAEIADEKEIDKHIRQAKEDLDDEETGEKEEEEPMEENREIREENFRTVRPEEQLYSPIAQTESSRFGLLQLPRLNRKILFGGIALLLTLVLIGSIVLTKQTKQNTQTQAAFEKTYAEAAKKYDEAEGLKNLNASLAQDDYKKAESLLKTGLAQVEKGSEEEQKMTALLKKVQANLVTAEGDQVRPTSAELDDVPSMNLATKYTLVADDDGTLYYLSGKTIKKEDSETAIDGDWTSPKGIGAYNGNIYVLDTKNGITKYTAGSDGYGDSVYLSGDNGAMEKAVAMAIDGSIWVLMNDGTVKKYTRGKDDGFSISGLPSPMKSPTAISTNADTDDIVILDSGNSRILVVTKDGAFKKAYKADGFNTATHISVDGTEKKIYILSNKKLSMIPLE